MQACRLANGEALSPLPKRYMQILCVFPRGVADKCSRLEALKRKHATETVWQKARPSPKLLRIALCTVDWR
jgi:hypothetical protein